MKTKAARLSIYSNITLTILKLVVGLVTGSISVLSESIHSAVDLLASFIAFLAVRAAETPADRDHPYGHGKYENVSGAAEGFLILLAGGYIAYEAFHKIASRSSPDHLGLGIAVMIVSASVNGVISNWLLKVGHQTQSDALLADAYHLRADVYTSVGVLAGLGLAAVTGSPLFDPLAALAVTVLIFMMGWKTMRGSVTQLLDVALPVSEVDRIAEIVRAHPEIKDFHQIRTRRVGGQKQVDLHIQVSGDMSVRDGHEIAHQLQDRIQSEMGDVHVVTHIEPWRGKNQTTEGTGL